MKTQQENNKDNVLRNIGKGVVTILTIPIRAAYFCVGTAVGVAAIPWALVSGAVSLVKKGGSKSELNFLNPFIGFSLAGSFYRDAFGKWRDKGHIPTSVEKNTTKSEAKNINPNKAQENKERSQKYSKSSVEEARVELAMYNKAKSSQTPVLKQAKLI